jgi:hypothetical protein
MNITFYAEAEAETNTWIKRIAFTVGESEKNGGTIIHTVEGRYDIGVQGQIPLYHSINLKSV